MGGAIDVVLFLDSHACTMTIITVCLLTLVQARELEMQENSYL